MADSSPDSPDFDALAKRIVELTDIRLIRSELQRVWKARGAVDISTMEVDLSTMMGATAAGPYLKNLNRTLRALDRQEPSL